MEDQRQNEPGKPSFQPEPADARHGNESGKPVCQSDPADARHGNESGKPVCQPDPADARHGIDYRLLFENMLNGFARCRIICENDIPVDFEYLVVNPAFEAITGLADPAGKRVTELIPGVRETSPELFEIYGRVASTGITERFEVFMESLGKWFSVAAYSGVPGYFTVVFDDISVRKEMESNLQRHEKFFRELTENFNDILWETDPAGLFTWISGNLHKVTGYQATEFIGLKYFYDLLHPTVRERIKADMYAVIERKQTFRNQVALHQHRDGRKIYLEANGIPVFGDKGELQGYRGTVKDVTRREEALELLHLSEKRYATIFQHAPLIFVISDPASGKIMDVNLFFEQVTGFTREETIGHTADDLGYFRPGERNRIFEIYRRDGRVNNMEIVFICRNKEELILDYSNVRIQIDGRDLVLAMALDITQAKKTENALNKSELLLRQSRMNPHFIFNAMNSIQSYILKNDIDNALHYLSLFSKLIRATLEHSHRQHITLAEELTYLVSFVDIQKMRFACHFEMQLVIDPAISIETTMIPPMMVQPLVENAIRQGLLCSDRPGKLRLEIIKDSNQVYRFVIAENGNCSKSRDELRENDRLENETRALDIVRERIQLSNELSKSDVYRLAFTKLTDAAGRHDGTRVEVTFPLVVD